MADQLNGKRIAFLVAREGVEEVEPTEPWAGATPEPIAIVPNSGALSSTAPLLSPTTCRAARRVELPIPDRNCVNRRASRPAWRSVDLQKNL